MVRNCRSQHHFIRPCMHKWNPPNDWRTTGAGQSGGTVTIFTFSAIAPDSIQYPFQAPLTRLSRHLEHVVHGQEPLLVEVERLRVAHCVLGLLPLKGSRLARWPISTPRKATTEVDSGQAVVERTRKRRRGR